MKILCVSFSFSSPCFSLSLSLYITFLSLSLSLSFSPSLSISLSLAGWLGWLGWAGLLGWLGWPEAVSGSVMFLVSAACTSRGLWRLQKMLDRPYLILIVLTPGTRVLGSSVVCFFQDVVSSRKGRDRWEWVWNKYDQETSPHKVGVYSRSGRKHDGVSLAVVPGWKMVVLSIYPGVHSRKNVNNAI